MNPRAIAENGIRIRKFEERAAFDYPRYPSV